jgi:hypothetical protein
MSLLFVFGLLFSGPWGIVLPDPPPAMILRRLGTSPSQRASAECVACNNCPDLFELAGGDFAIIGFDVTDEVVPHLPSDAGCGAGERIVRIPRAVLVAARASIPELC